MSFTSGDLLSEWPFWFVSVAGFLAIALGIILIRNCRLAYRADAELRMIRLLQYRISMSHEEEAQQVTKRRDSIECLSTMTYDESQRTIESGIARDDVDGVAGMDNDDEEEEKPTTVEEETGQLEECSICLCHFEAKDEVVLSNNPCCRHVFHKDCMVSWLVIKDDANCPLCREIFLLKEETV